MTRVLLFVVLTAMAVTLVRWLVRRTESARRLRRPGYTPSHPVRVVRYDEIDTCVTAERCVCGGPLRTLAEGGTGTLRVVHTECGRCSEATDLYFDVSAVRH